MGMEDMAPRRLALLTVLAAALGLAGGAAAVLLVRLIGLIANPALFHRVGTDIPSFADWQPGLLLIPAAMAGGLVVSLLARRWPVIRGHGIPETMEAVLLRQSRTSPGVAVAKPVSAAVAIGTGGPFGAEGPIIVTGGALGSLVGQFLHVSPAERKILLACGAAAGMAATFGAPLAAVIRPSSCSCSSSRRVPSCRLWWRRAWRPACTPWRSGPGRCSTCRPAASRGSNASPSTSSSAWRAACSRSW